MNEKLYSIGSFKKNWRNHYLLMDKNLTLTKELLNKLMYKKYFYKLVQFMSTTNNLDKFLRFATGLSPVLPIHDRDISSIFAQCTVSTMNVKQID